MTNLTQTAFYMRRLLKIGVFLVLLLIIFRTSLKITSRLWLKYHPTPPPPPTVAFGKLPKLSFPENPKVADKKFSFKLETIQGGLPKLSDIGKVYFMPKEGSNFLSLDRASEWAKKIGFTNEPQQINESTYKWTTQTSPSTTLEMNIFTGNFKLRYEYENDQELFDNKNLPTNQQAAQEAKNFLTTNDLLKNDLENGSATFNYFRFDVSDLVPAVSLSEADFVRVNLFKADLDEMKILPADPKKSLISFLFSGSRVPGKRIIEINYTYYPVEKAAFATYPLKSITQAWNQVQAGEASINLGQNEGEQITIREVYLAYYDSADYQPYLQPVYVFAGDKDFTAFVPAIESSWME